MTKALLIIDYINDLVADNGALTCGKPAQGLEDYLVQLASRFYQNGSHVIFPTDARYRDRFSPGAKLFPPHNAVGMSSQQLYGKINDWFEQYQANDRVHQFNKNRYSPFQDTNLDNYLRGRKTDNLWIAGVYTDIYILYTVIAAYNLNYQTTIPVKGVTTFIKHGQEWVLDHFKNSLGVTLA